MAKNDNAVPTVVTVEKITERTAKSGNSYWTVTSSGEFYNVWDTTVRDGLEEGQTYTLMVASNTSGDKVFHNAVGFAENTLSGTPLDFNDIMPSTTPPPKQTPANNVFTPAPKQYIQDPEIDVRKTALTCAVTLLAADKVTQKSMNVILRKFEGYITKGIPVDQLNEQTHSAVQDIAEFVANE